MMLSGLLQPLRKKAVLANTATMVPTTMRWELNQSRIWPWSSTNWSAPTASTKSPIPTQSVFMSLMARCGR